MGRRGGAVETMGGRHPPHSCMNLKKKGLQNGFPQVVEKKRECTEGDEFQNGNWWVYLGTLKTGVSPVFFVSVASKGLSQSVSLLFATLAGRSISVAGKGLKAIVGSGQWTVPTGSGSALHD